ncbi:MAG: membrane protein insertion efficiency factor YidD [Christensenellales bacterium]|jgi:putative membrane protein insertion efficiency factor
MISRALIYLISLYRKYLSPVLPRACKYHPTCSAYAIGALKAHGAFKGTALSTWRLLRCNPFSHGGYDPVPPKGIPFLKMFSYKPKDDPDDDYHRP